MRYTCRVDIGKILIIDSGALGAAVGLDPCGEVTDPSAPGALQGADSRAVWQASSSRGRIWHFSFRGEVTDPSA